MTHLAAAVVAHHDPINSFHPGLSGPLGYGVRGASVASRNQLPFGSHCIATVIPTAVA